MAEIFQNVKLAWDTQLWGARPEDWHAVLSTIAGEGFSGVAFSQRVEFLPAKSLRELKELLKGYGLSVASLAGCTLFERMAFCGDEKDVPLIGQSLARERFREAIDQGFGVHLRPHPFRELRDSLRAEELLNEFPQLGYAPDSANAEIAKEDILVLIKKHIQRISMVFLEDWTRIFGASGQRFFRGYTDLGQGDVSLAKIVGLLRELNYDRWLVLGRSVAPQGDAPKCVRRAAEWVRTELKIPLSPIEPLASGIQHDKSSEEAENSRLQIPTRPVFDAPMPWLGSLYEFYEYTVNWFRRFADERGVEAPCVTLWSCSPHNDILSILAADPQENAFSSPVINCRDALTSMALYRQAVSVFVTNDPTPAGKYGDPARKYKGAPGSTHLISLPLSSPACPTHVRWILNIRAKFATLEAAEQFAADAAQLGDVVAGYAHAVLDEQYGIAAAKARILAARAANLQECLTGLISLAKQTLHCECGTIFLASDNGERLIPVETTGLAWMGNEKFYRPTDRARTTEAWQKNRTLITYGEPRPLVEWKSYEPLPHLGPVEACSLIQPFTSPVNERVMGVMRCRGKRPTFDGMKSIFTEDDVALTEAILQPCIPYLARWAELAREDRLAAALWHELRTPISKIRSNAEQAKATLRRLGQNSALQEVRHPAIVEAHGEVDTFLERVLRDIGVVRATAEDIAILISPTGDIVLENSRISFVEDVLNPAIGRLPPDAWIRKVEYEGEFPLIFGDIRRLEQVFANLVSNAYRACGSTGLHIRFQARVEGNETLVIDTMDFGPGFAPTDEPDSFFLTPPDVPATLPLRKPLGLWVSGLLVRAMGGKISVTKHQGPTTITIRLPLRTKS